MKRNRLKGVDTMSVGECCANCGGAAKSRKRDFSSQAWSFLVLWNEVGKSAVDGHICNHCYGELRDVLIDRVDEIDSALHQNNNTNESEKRQRARKAS